MRLWSIHPKYLDAKGLVALWREGLLAQSVLQGCTRGYRHHPQLMRFKLADSPQGAIADYLRAVLEEAEKRGYRFDRSKIADIGNDERILVTHGQLEYEFSHLLSKLKVRDPGRYEKLMRLTSIDPNPVMDAVEGQLEHWEKIK